MAFLDPTEVVENGYTSYGNLTKVGSTKSTVTSNGHAWMWRPVEA